jgi:poly(A) polymerase
VHVYFNKGDFVEITTFRGPEDQDHTKADNYGTPEEDAQRRDLTINALFYDPFSGEILDYVGGLEDLKRGIIRVIGIPELRYRRDPIRMLRVIRHAARTGFEIDRETWEALLKSKELIKIVSRERLRDEILKDLSGFWLKRWFKILKESALLYEIYPFYKNLENKLDFSESFLLDILKIIEGSELNLEQRIVLFVYPFLPFIQRTYKPDLYQNMPTFERKELLKLFWALFFTFRYSRGLFEKTMDMFRDLYKMLYLKLKGREIPKRFKRKIYYSEIVPLLDILSNLIKNKGRRKKDES